VGMKSAHVAWSPCSVSRYIAAGARKLLTAAGVRCRPVY